MTKSDNSRCTRQSRSKSHFCWQHEFWTKYKSEVRNKKGRTLLELFVLLLTGSWAGYSWINTITNSTTKELVDEEKSDTDIPTTTPSTTTTTINESIRVFEFSSAEFESRLFKHISWANKSTSAFKVICDSNYILLVEFRVKSINEFLNSVSKPAATLDFSYKIVDLKNNIILQNYLDKRTISNGFIPTKIKKEVKTNSIIQLKQSLIFLCKK